MPPLVALLPTIAAIAGLAGTGISVGETLANSGSKPAAPAPTPPPDQQTLLRQRELAGQQASNIEGQTSGAAGPDFLSLFAPYLAGISGQPGADAAGKGASGQGWAPANSQPTNAAVTNQPVNLSDFINTST